MSNKTMVHSDGLPFALARWIKAQRETDVKHKNTMVITRAKDDEDFMDILALVSMRWNELKVYEKAMVMNLFAWKEDGKNFTDKQRGVISGFYVAHREKFK